MPALQALQDLGLNQLEAEIYLFLLPQPPMTAYRVAKHLGKPAANVYKAIDVLARKGAVLLDDGDSRTCRAIPAKDFLRRAQRDFSDVASRAQAHLASIETAPLDERVYRLETTEQVFLRCREMAESATRVLVVDAFPLTLNRIRDWLEAAAARGVAVHVEAYEPVEIRGADVIVVPMGDRPVQLWRSQQLNIVSDGRENLMALLDRTGAAVLQAYWSNSLYLSCLHHAGRLCEQTILRALAADKAGGNPIAILRAHPFFLESDVPGQKELMQRHASLS